MNPGFECRSAASLLDSGRVLVNASNCAALIAGFGMLAAHPGAGRLWFGASILCWPVAVYFGVRVAIDASLFRALADESADGGRALDQWLRAHGLARLTPEQTIAERTRGALRLWIRLIAVVAGQLLLAIAALGIQAFAP